MLLWNKIRDSRHIVVTVEGELLCIGQYVIVKILYKYVFL